MKFTGSVRLGWDLRKISTVPSHIYWYRWGFPLDFSSSALIFCQHELDICDCVHLHSHCVRTMPGLNCRSWQWNGQNLRLLSCFHLPIPKKKGQAKRATFLSWKDGYAAAEILNKLVFTYQKKYHTSPSLAKTKRIFHVLHKKMRNHPSEVLASRLNPRKMMVIWKTPLTIWPNWNISLT